MKVNLSLVERNAQKVLSANDHKCWLHCWQSVSLACQNEKVNQLPSVVQLYNIYPSIKSGTTVMMKIKLKIGRLLPNTKLILN